MSLIAKARKLGHFIGPARFDGPPVFVNSMPKAGTNLIEGFLIALGYKRNPAKCLNESNIGGITLRRKRGRFYVAHLAEDRLIDTQGQTAIFLQRPLWACLKSYVNYMHIDTAHPISRMIRETPLEQALERLLFTDDNPNGRPLVDEYLRFEMLDMGRYDLIVSFGELVGRDPALIAALAQTLGGPPDRIAQALDTALEAESYTKNLGRIDLFTALPEDRLAALQARVAARATEVAGQPQG
jgi:hypothetical protein